MDVRAESGAWSSTGPSAFVPSALPMEVVVRHPDAGPSALGSGVSRRERRESQ